MKEGQQGLQGVCCVEQHLNWTQVHIGGVSWSATSTQPSKAVTD